MEVYTRWLSDATGPIECGGGHSRSALAERPEKTAGPALRGALPYRPPLNESWLCRCGSARTSDSLYGRMEFSLHGQGSPRYSCPHCRPEEGRTAPDNATTRIGRGAVHYGSAGLRRRTDSAYARHHRGDHNSIAEERRACVP